MHVEQLRELGPVRERRALARCVADPDELERVWGVRHLLSCAASLPGSFDDLLDLDAVDELLSRRGLRTPFLRLAKDGTVVDPARYTRSGGVGAEIADQIDDAAVARLFGEGTTIVLQGLHRLWPPLVGFATQLGVELGHPVQINAYVTPPSSKGFAAHYDVHDVFVLQLAGDKRWIVHEPVFEAPLRSQPWTQRRSLVEHAAEKREPLADVVLRPGDALYLPRGFVHAAEALGAISAHLTVGIHVVTRMTVAQALLELAQEDLELRRSLPLGLDLADAGSLEHHVEETAAALVESLGSADTEAVAWSLRSRVWPSSRPGPLRPLVQASTVAAPELRLRLRPGLRVLLERERLVADGRTFAFDVDAIAVLRVLLDGEEHVLESVPGDPNVVLRVAETMLRECVVVPL